MKNQFDRFIDILRALEKFKVDYVLVGGFAVILYGFNRPTEDIDLFIKRIPENVEKLRKALRSVFDDDAIEEIVFDDLENYAVIRYGAPDDFHIDIISRIGEAFSFEDIEYEELELEGTRIKIAKPDILYRMKKNTMREKDKVDLLFLKKLKEYLDKKNADTKV